MAISRATAPAGDYGNAARALGVVSDDECLPAHYLGANAAASFEMGARCMAKPIPESSCEMDIVAKAAGVRDFV